MKCKFTYQVESKYESSDLPSLDFIAGFIVGQGSFMHVKQNHSTMSVFQIKAHIDEKPLIEMIRTKLDLTEKIHEYTHDGRHYVILLVRKRWVIANKLIPALDGRLFGIKKHQYIQWRDEFFQNILSDSRSSKIVRCETIEGAVVQ